MGEIKSTLDLIMERTKNLTMSEEEKRALRNKENAGKVKGLVQRHLDGSISGERLREEVAALRIDRGEASMVNRLFRADILARIMLGQDNAALLAVLKTVIGEDPAPLKRILEEYEKRAQHLCDSRREILREKFRRNGISGAAVVPNLDADPEWRESHQNLEDQMRAALKTISGPLP